MRKRRYIELATRSFVYAVDSFGKFLDVLCSYKGIPQEIASLHNEFDARLPSVSKIRNSALHIEDRIRGYASWRDAKKGKKMDIKGFLGLSNLEGKRLCYTIDDGSYQCVDVTANTLDVLGDLLNRTLRAFVWEGPPHREPMF